ncbi:MAG: cyclic nucleotide-binding domain-containing protein [Clostridiales bacterium]|nr:cyclic nucleotide-binding domain-containing protein [Candidatus Blautia equi]
MREKNRNVDAVIKSLRTFDLFQTVSDEDLKELSLLVHSETFPAGTLIIKEGTEGDTLYLLLDGTVDILKTTIYGDQYVTASIASGGFSVFGEMALIDQDRRSATVQAKTECRTLRISRKDFQDYCRRFPSVGCELLFRISSNLVRNLRKENDNLKLVYEALIKEIEAY